MEGKLLSLEGISGTGKTYYRQKLEEKFKDNSNVIFMKEIFDEAQEGLGKKIFSALYHTEDRFFNMGVPLTETMLLLSRSMYKYESTIKKSLEAGKVVIEDRSIDTISIYQAILIAQQTGGNPLEIANEIYAFAQKFRKVPEITFLLQGDSDLAIKRAELRDRKQYKPEEVILLKRVDKLYTLYAERYPNRFVKCDIIKEDEEQILAKMQNEIMRSIQILKESKKGERE